MRGGSSRTWTSLLAALDSVRSFRNDGRVAETTMRAAPACKLGHALLAERPRHAQVARDRSAVTVAACVASSAKSGIVRPFCSSAIVSAVSRPPGASTVTSSVPVWPTRRSGLSMVTRGGAPRPATT